jgi:aspartate aminotransferase
MNVIARHMSAVKQSAASSVAAVAAELVRQGHDVIRLSAGEPDFATPDHVQLAGMRAIIEGKTKYPPIPGILPLREAICRKLERDNGLKYGPEQIIASAGCKQVIYNALGVTLDPGDEVVIPAPYFGCYVDQTTLNRGVPVVVETTQANGFRLMPEQLEAAITPRTKWLILNAPNNPSGAVYRPEDLKAVAEVLRRHPQVWLLSDDIYEHLIYEGAVFHSVLEFAPDLAERTLVVNGFSKTYSMTGWRLGYGAGPVGLIKNMVKLQSQSTSGACSISQWAAVAALEGDHGFVAKNRVVFQQRRDLVVAKVNAIEGLFCLSPEGAFYVFVSCTGLLGRLTPEGKVLETEADVVEFLLHHAHVAVIHGASFGLSPFFRISFAAKTEQLEEACRRIAEACSRLT